jgi:hypothetical protein
MYSISNVEKRGQGTEGSKESIKVLGCGQGGNKEKR